MKFRFVLIVLAITALGCTPSGVYYKRYALYNFEDEGFLASDLVQTIGTSEMPRLDTGIIQKRRQCLNAALDNARDRMISIFLHTHQDIDGSGVPVDASMNPYSSDYPVVFSARDIMLGTVTFRNLLDSAFIALQDSRSQKSCTIVLRIIDEDISTKIRAVDLEYELESIPPKTENERKNIPASDPL